MAHHLRQSNFVAAASHAVRRGPRLHPPPHHSISAATAAAFRDVRRGPRLQPPRASPAVFPLDHHHLPRGGLGPRAAARVRRVLLHGSHDHEETYYYPDNIRINNESGNNILDRAAGWVEEEGTMILSGNITTSDQQYDDDHHNHHMGSDGGGGLSEEIIGRCLKTRKPCPDDDDKVCAVCLDDLCRDDDDETSMNIGVLDNCRHEFHVGCIKQWLTNKNVCPLCRAIALGQ